MENLNPPNDNSDQSRFRCFLPDPDQPTPPIPKTPAIKTARGLIAAYEYGHRLFAGLTLPAGSNLQSAMLDDGQFGLSILDGVHFTNAHLNRADFSAASLNGAILQNAELVGARFDDCDLNQTDLRGADLAAVSWANAAWDHDTPPRLDHRTNLIPPKWHLGTSFTPNAEDYFNLHRQFDGLEDDMLAQLLKQTSRQQGTILENMLYHAPLVLNMENWRDQRKQVAEKHVSPYSPQL